VCIAELPAAQFGIELDDVTTEKQIKRKEHQLQKTDAEEDGDEEARACFLSFVVFQTTLTQMTQMPDHI